MDKKELIEQLNEPSAELTALRTENKRLEKALENAIVPKFKAEQKVLYIPENIVASILEFRYDWHYGNRYALDNGYIVYENDLTEAAEADKKGE